MRGNITRRGKASWRVKFDLDRDPVSGKRQTRYVTVRGKRQDAERELARLLNEAHNGTLVEPSKLTVAEYMRARVEHWHASKQISAKTAERYRELVENQITPHIGNTLLQKLRPLDLEKWHTALDRSGRKDGKSGVSKRTVGHAHRVLFKALNEAVKHGLIIQNAAAVEKAPKVQADEMVILTSEQVSDLAAKLRGHAMCAEAITALFTGLRRGELLALRWKNVDLENEKLIRVRQALEHTAAFGIRFKEPKTKAGRRDVSLPDIVVEALRDRRRQQLEIRMALGLGKLPDEALVFPALDGEPQTPRVFSKRWTVAARALGAGDITFHALRHTHASQLIDAGIDIVTISRRLGHSSPAVTLSIYAHLFRQRDDKAAKAINDALAGIGEL